MHDATAAPVLGFAATWAPQPETTWSGTPWSLLQALRDRTEVIDLGVHPSRARRAAFKGAYVRRQGGRFVTTYKHAPRYRAWIETSLRRAVADRPVDAVIEIGDLAVLDRPFLLYQDLCYDAVLDAFDDDVGAALHFPGLSRDDLERGRDRQLQVYDAASGILTMSRWLADRLVVAGVAPAKIHVVAARDRGADGEARRRRRDRRRRSPPRTAAAPALRRPRLPHEGG